MVESLLGSAFYGMFYPIWQPFVLSLGASVSIVGGLGAILSLLGSLSSLFWGRLSDSVGRKPFIILSSVLRAIALGICLMAKTWYLLIPYAILMGLSASYQQWNPANASMVADSVEREERGTAYSVIMAFSMVVSAIVAPLGGLVAMIYGLYLIFYGCVAADIFCLLVTWLFIRETVERERPRQSQSWRTLLLGMFRPEVKLKGFYASMVVDAFAYGLAFAILYGMLVETYGFTEYQLGLLSAISSLAWALSQIPIGKLMDKHGRKPFLLLSELMAIMTLSGWLFSRDFLSFAILQVSSGVMIAAGVPTSTAMLADSVPKEKRAEAMGRLQAFRGLLAFPAPYVGGLLYDAFGFHLPVVANLIGSITAFVLILLLVRETT
ncbi:MAG: MFS transporter [Candidatus Bathyarchaeia archaeon]